MMDVILIEKIQITQIAWTKRADPSRLHLRFL